MDDSERIEFLIQRLEVEEGDGGSSSGVFWMPPTASEPGWGYIGIQQLELLPEPSLFFPLKPSSSPVLPLLQALEGIVLHDRQPFTQILNEIPQDPSLTRELVNLFLKAALREWLLSQPGYRLGGLCGNFDLSLWAALEQIHQDPSRTYALGDLAEMGHMCRSGFASRFREVVGIPALQYVRLLRLDLAQKMLQGDALPLQMVAEHVGYSCAKCLSKAFSRSLVLKSRKPDPASRWQGGIASR